MLSMRNPLDVDGDGVVSRSDFMPTFLDRDGDGHFGFGDMSHDVRTKAKKAANGYMRDKVEQMYVDIYLLRLKPGLTADRRMPWPLRKMIHEVVDDMWHMLRLELPKALDKMFGEGGEAAEEKAEEKAAALEKKKRPPSLPPSPPSPLLMSLPSAPSLPPSPPSLLLMPLPSAPSLPPSPPSPPARGPSRVFFKPAPPPAAPETTEEEEWAADTIGYFTRRKEDVGIATQEARERKAARLLACYIRRHLTLKRKKEARTLLGRIKIFHRRWERPFRKTADSWRSWLLYYHMPFDQTTFGKFHMWQSVLLLAIAASPVWYLRASFFTIFLGCLMRDMEEFQFVRFILGLKGSGFISGVIAAVKVSIDLWQCTVLKPMTCHLNGPGIGNPVFEQIVIICWLQVVA